MRRAPPSTRNSISSSRRAPLPWRSSSSGEIVGEPRQRDERRLAGRDRAGEAPLDAEVGRGKARRDRAAFFAGERVEAGDHVGAEAGGDRRARPEREIADAAQAGARHVGAGLGVEPERGGRHVVIEPGEILAGEAGGRDAAMGEARQRPGGARRIGEAGRDRQPLARKPRLDLGDQPLLAAEQMGDAGDVEHQPVAPVERGERREARAGVGDALQQPRFGLRLGVADDERGLARLRVGERQADAEAEPRGVERRRRRAGARS